ncbi:hypothetical protein BU26DRAFT_240565 [Trematosphaeria pertusa]|uniref:Uncharacterized protein n=1 Tax=Trematosphaeria pertusa TaxID=390896 RepID=A0A6A6IN11_9PLEO|nr:uncharacterized protein BU26DRAFT_240565 [Trematosphaeria pertusa]KAF2251627.1 hypothetical protein BU26DRAFT_240565 [Trematosphaeria pertusa]
MFAIHHSSDCIKRQFDSITTLRLVRKGQFGNEHALSLGLEPSVSIHCQAIYPHLYPQFPIYLLNLLPLPLPHHLIELLIVLLALLPHLPVPLLLLLPRHLLPQLHQPLHPLLIAQPLLPHLPVQIHHRLRNLQILLLDNEMAGSSLLLLLPRFRLVDSHHAEVILLTCGSGLRARGGEALRSFRRGV